MERCLSRELKSEKGCLDTLCVRLGNRILSAGRDSQKRLCHITKNAMFMQSEGPKKDYAELPSRKTARRIGRSSLSSWEVT
jgi:hypothetical protein